MYAWSSLTLVPLPIYREHQTEESANLRLTWLSATDDTAEVEEGLSDLHTSAQKQDKKQSIWKSLDSPGEEQWYLLI